MCNHVFQLVDNVSHMFKMRHSKEAKEVVALQRAALVYKVIVYKHIVGICSTLIAQSKGLALMMRSCNKVQGKQNTAVSLSLSLYKVK